MLDQNSPTKLAYSIPEAAAAVSIGRSKVYALIAEGRLETRKIGKRTVIPTASLVALLEGDA
jgi:excisionase family DNA binding protein